MPGTERMRAGMGKVLGTRLLKVNSELLGNLMVNSECWEILWGILSVGKSDGEF